MKLLSLVLALLALFFLSGCFDLSEEIWFNNDGTGRIKYDFGLSEALIELSNPGGPSTLFKEFKEQYEQHPKVKKFVSKEYKEGGLHHFVFDIEVKDVNEVDDILNALLKQQSQAMDEKKDSMESPTVVLEQTSDGKVNFTQVLDRNAKKETSATDSTVNHDSSGAWDESMGKAMTSSMFGDKFISVKIHAPKFIITNGKLDEQNRTAEWKVSLADIMSKSAAENIVKAEIQLQKPVNWILWVGIGAAAGLLIGLITYLLLRKKEKTSVQLSDEQKH